MVAIAMSQFNNNCVTYHIMGSPEAKIVWFVGQTSLTRLLNSTQRHRDYHVYS